MTSTTMTIRLEEEMKNRLEKLAKITHRSKSYLATQAIDEYIKIQEWQLQEITRGIAEADAGHVIAHEEIVKFWENKQK